MDDNELIQWYKRVFDEYPSVGLLAFIREVMEQPAATAPIPVYAEHAEKPVAYVADEQPAPEGMMSEDVREAMHVMLIAWRYYHGETTSYKIARDWLDQQRPATTAGKEEQHCE